MDSIIKKEKELGIKKAKYIDNDKKLGKNCLISFLIYSISFLFFNFIILKVFKLNN
jgi:hypothetical protein